MTFQNTKLHIQDMYIEVSLFVLYRKTLRALKYKYYFYKSRDTYKDIINYQISKRGNDLNIYVCIKSMYFCSFTEIQILTQLYLFKYIVLYNKHYI